MKEKSVRDIQQLSFPVRQAAEASLCVYEQNSPVPFPMARVFTVDARRACDRGFHAHKDCTQILICLKGKVNLTVDDGKAKKQIQLDNPGTGVLIPPGIWGEQSYEQDSLLMVLCDRPYDESDYIRDYDEFRLYKGAAA